MNRANIKNTDDVYIGYIAEKEDGFRIVWNSNKDNYPEYSHFESDEVFKTLEEACQGVYKFLQDAKISETIHFNPEK